MRYIRKVLDDIDAGVAAVSSGFAVVGLVVFSLITLPFLLPFWIVGRLGRALNQSLDINLSEFPMYESTTTTTKETQ